MSFLAMLLAVIIASLLQPLFILYTQKSESLFNQAALWICILSLTFGTGILSGIYPAFYLSSFKPISVLKGKLINSFSGSMIRKGLVVFQFIISICLILSVIVMEQQLRFINRQQLGFNKNQQIILPLQSPEAIKNYQILKNDLLKNPAIKSVTSGSTYPGIANIEDMLFYAEGKTVSNVVDIALANVDDNYLETLGLKLIAGRGFSREFAADSNSIILNESAINTLGYNIQTAIGKNVYYDFQGTHNVMLIVGIVRNFNFESLYNSIKPFAFNKVLGNRYSYLIANFRTDDYKNILKETEQTWRQINPGIPFVYSFMDKDFQKNYEKDQRISAMVEYFTFIAILIACMGLFGLSTFAAEQRIKEIGIRKVLGASVFSIVTLLSGDFIRIVIIAICISLPLGWYILDNWLSGFDYRIHINWWMISLTCLLAILIAVFTVSFQAIKAAVANQVKNLRSE
jgi:putative ABC transport system permease protein